MTCPASWTRRATPVQAMQLDDLRDLHVAERWLAAHGLTAAQRHPALTERGLLVPTGPRSYRIARLGEWLTLDAVSGRFDVHDQQEFRRLHEQEETA